MKFSAKGDYSVIAAIDVALHAEEGPVSIRDIAGRQKIPLHFLEQVMNSLKKAGLVESIRGAEGGYLLSKPPHDIRVGDLLQATEGPIAPMNCLKEGKEKMCLVHVEPLSCVVHEIWSEVRASILDVLNSVTLDDLCRRKKEREAGKALMLR